MTVDQRVYRLKVTLRGIRPPIWRRIEVPAAISLFDLHATVQAAMGWDDCHLHQFIHGGIYYGPPDREFDMPMESERRTRLADLLRQPKDRLTYEYDFGDNWQHEVMLEAIGEVQPEAKYPRVVDGKRACPPEDVGGVPGYEDFVLAIRDPEHEEHASMLEWVGGRFDPEHFDVITANDRVPKRKAARPRGA